MLPLVAFALWVVLRRVLARPLTRHALNVQQAMLLLIYFAVTSALGIFWVANQQLPAFDLHYLFGYATVLLVAAHLAINWRLICGYFTKPRRPARASGDAAAMAAHSPARAARFPWGAAAVMTLILLAFALGTRYGGGGMRVTWDAASSSRPLVSTPATPRGGDAPAGPPTAGPVDVVERYHAFSSHDRTGVLTRAPSVDWGAPPEPFKTYGDRPTVALPPPPATLRRDNHWPVGDALMGRAAPGPASRRLSIDALATLLHHAVGVTERSGGFSLRAAPSSGALFPTEFYVLARDVDGLAPGAYHFDAQHHRLTRLGDLSAQASDAGVTDADAGRAPAMVLLTSIFRRTGYKYRDRAYRYAVADAGHALENLRVAATCVGFMARPLRHFDEARAASTVGVDGVEEGPLAILALEAPTGPEAVSPLAFQWPAPPSPDRPDALGVTGLVHLATSLRLVRATTSPVDGGAARPEVAPPVNGDAARGEAASPLSGYAAAQPAAESAPPADAIALPPPESLPAPALGALLSRRSVRRFADEPLTLAQLSTLLSTSGQPSAALSEAVRIHVVCHAVAGVEPGAYRYDRASHALLPSRRGNLRGASASAALNQDVIGDGGAVLILALDRRALFAADGARGYRQGFLEAGMVGERLYLAAGAQGLGACAVGAFYDEEAARLIGVGREREWVVHFAAVGRPAR